MFLQETNSTHKQFLEVKDVLTKLIFANILQYTHVSDNQVVPIKLTLNQLCFRSSTPVGALGSSMNRQELIHRSLHRAQAQFCL